AQVLREVPGPAVVRQGLVPVGRVPVLLARARDRGRVLRLLPRLPRVLEAVRHGPAGRCAAEALLRERAEDRAGDPEGAVRAVGGRGRSRSRCALAVHAAGGHGPERARSTHTRALPARPAAAALRTAAHAAHDGISGDGTVVTPIPRTIVAPK